MLKLRRRWCWCGLVLNCIVRGYEDLCLWGIFEWGYVVFIWRRGGNEFCGGCFDEWIEWLVVSFGFCLLFFSFFFFLFSLWLVDCCCRFSSCLVIYRVFPWDAGLDIWKSGVNWMPTRWLEYYSLRVATSSEALVSVHECIRWTGRKSLRDWSEVFISEPEVNFGRASWGWKERGMKVWEDSVDLLFRFWSELMCPIWIHDFLLWIVGAMSTFETGAGLWWREGRNI